MPVSNLFVIVHDKIDVPHGQFRILSGTRELAYENDTITLSDYNIQNGTILTLVLSIRGGGGKRKNNVIGEKYVKKAKNEEVDDEGDVIDAIRDFAEKETDPSLVKEVLQKKEFDVKKYVEAASNENFAIIEDVATKMSSYGSRGTV
eukprot:6489234-Amphidinium_carterae.1